MNILMLQISNVSHLFGSYSHRKKHHLGDPEQVKSLCDSVLPFLPWELTGFVTGPYCGKNAVCSLVTWAQVPAPPLNFSYVTQNDVTLVSAQFL